MAVISSMITLQSQYFNSKAPDKMLQDITTRIESMALVHEMVYKHQNFAEINCGELLKRLVVHLQKIFQSDDREISVQIRADDVMLDMNKSIPFTLLVSEVVTNTFKHAFTDRKTGLIEVDLQKKNGGYRLVVQDDGVGVSNMDQLHNAESFGHTIIQGLAGQLHGEIAFSVPPNGGFKVKVWFPGKYA